MIDRVRENRNHKKVIRVSLRESYGEIRRVPVNLSSIISDGTQVNLFEICSKAKASALLQIPSY